MILTTIVVRRIFSLIPVLLIVAAISFSLTHLAPGDPAANILGEDASPAAVEELRERLGLSDPIVVQFGRWLSGVLRGDLGMSLYGNRTVTGAIVSRLEPTLMLMLMSITLAICIGVPVGIVGAVQRRTAVDQTLLVVTLLGVSMPNFWLGLNFILIFSVMLRLLPVAGYVPLATDWTATLLHLTMPALALGLSQAAIIARITRTSVIEVLRLDFVRTAHAKGLSGARVILKHVLRNAAIPVLTVAGVVVALLLSGSIVIETVFNLPGIGRLTIEAVQRRDYPMIQGIVLCIATINVTVNLIIDMLYLLIDPRIQYG